MLVALLAARTGTRIHSTLQGTPGGGIHGGFYSRAPRAAVTMYSAHGVAAHTRTRGDYNVHGVALHNDIEGRG